jgi:hypothetical protein
MSAPFPSHCSRDLLEGYGQLIGRDAGETLEHRPQLLQHLGLFGGSVATPQDTVQCCMEASSPAVYPEPLGYERNTTQTKLPGTFITAVWIRGIFLVIFALVSSGTKPSSMIAVYNGVGIASEREDCEDVRCPRAYECPFGTRINFLFTNSSRPRFESSLP